MIEKTNSNGDTWLQNKRSKRIKKVKRSGKDSNSQWHCGYDMSYARPYKWTIRRTYNINNKGDDTHGCCCNNITGKYYTGIIHYVMAEKTCELQRYYYIMRGPVLVPTTLYVMLLMYFPFYIHHFLTLSHNSSWVSCFSTDNPYTQLKEYITCKGSINMIRIIHIVSMNICAYCHRLPCGGKCLTIYICKHDSIRKYMISILRLMIIGWW